jgi:ribosomal protein L11 methyltransferase
VAENIINLYVPYGMYVEDYSDMEEFAPTMREVNYYSDELLNKDKTSAIIHIYMTLSDNPTETLSAIEERFRFNNIDFEKSSSEIDAEAMLSEWKKYYKPTRISESITVVPSWIDYNPEENEKILSMDPENAFGSGTHESTSLCASLIEKYMKDNSTVLDIGTGTGILAICALLLGAKFADGVDIDPVAVETAKKNAIKNNVADKSNFLCGDLCDKIKGKYDIIIANIVADVIINLLSFSRDFLNDDGIMIVSGIIDDREKDVLLSIEQNGFTVVEKIIKNGWVAIAIK